MTIEAGMLVTHESGRVEFVEFTAYDNAGNLTVTTEGSRPIVDYETRFKPTLCEYEVEFLIKLLRGEDIPWGAAVSVAIESCKSLKLVTYPTVRLTERGERVARFEAMRADLKEDSHAVR